MSRKNAEGQHGPTPFSTSPSTGTRIASPSLQERSARQGRRDARSRRWKLVAGGVALAIVAVVAVCVGTFVQAYGQAQDVMTSLKGVATATMTGDEESLATYVDEVGTETAALERTVNGPVLGALAHLGLGGDIQNIQTMVSILSQTHETVLVPLAERGDELEGDIAVEDTINTDALMALIDIVEDLHPEISELSESAQNLGTGLIPQVNSIASRVKSSLAGVDSLIDWLDVLKPNLPELLGSDGETRAYLLVAQNNAELRPTGGIPGSWGVVTITDGKIVFGDLGEPDKYTSEGISLTAADHDLMGQYETYMVPGSYWVSANFDPDFPRSAMHLADYWYLIMNEVYAGENSGVQEDAPAVVDGVIAVDPILVQRLLGLTDGFDLEDGTHIDGTNATKVLLSDSYWNVDQDTQNSYFSGVASGALQTIMGSLTDMDLSALYAVLVNAGERGDLQMWFSDEGLEDAATELGFDGAVSTDADNPELGVYFYDITWSKMDWYLNQVTEVGDPVVNSDGSVSYTCTTTLINEMTEEEAEAAPDYVVSFGDNSLVANRGGMATVVYLYAPYGGDITIDECNTGNPDADNFSKIGTNGYYVCRGVVVLDPQKRATITYTVTTAAGATGDLTVRTTPTCTEVAGWREDDKDDEDFEIQDSSSYGTASADASESLSQSLESWGVGSAVASTSSSSYSYTQDTDTYSSYDEYGYDSGDDYDYSSGYAYDYSYDSYDSYDDTDYYSYDSYDSYGTEYSYDEGY